MQPVIRLKHVTKRYGNNRGITDACLSVPKGAIFGFLGPNGAGKTTTISMLIDLIHPSAGKIELFGLDSQTDSQKIRSRIGFLAGDFALDPSMTGWQQLEYFGHLRGDKFDKVHVTILAKRFDCDLNRRIRTLSRGNKQKIGLISGLMHRPELLIFDEPTSGLDPIVQAEFNKLLKEHKEMGKTAFISSHLLSEVQETCDQVAFIREGRVIAVKSMTDLAATSPKQLQIRGADLTLKTALTRIKGLEISSAGKHTIRGVFRGDVNVLLRALASHKVQDIIIQQADLENIFMQYYEEQDV